MRLLKSPTQLLRSQVYEHLREEIRREHLAPGMFISMAELMERLDLGRTPLRDALLQLQAEGFVTFLPQRGIMINVLDLQDIRNLYEILGALDSRALLLVFDHLGPEQLEEMRRVNEAMIAADCSRDHGDYFNLNTRFHNVYLQLCRNLEIRSRLDIIRERLFQFGKKDWGNIVTMNYEEHLVMIRLIEEKKAKEAADFIRDVHCTLPPEPQYLNI